MNPRISLDQWRSLVAVVEAGSYARAAELLHKSQSTVTYAVQKLESTLGLAAFALQGRRSVLTPVGETLYRRAKYLLDEAAALEEAARELAAGTEAGIRLTVDIIFPTNLLFACLETLSAEYPLTRVELTESVLSGTTEALLEGGADLAVTPFVPAGFLGTPLEELRFVAVAHPDHPLHRLGRDLTLQDLRAHRQLVVRDTGVRGRRDAGWLGAEQRWTVSHIATSIEAACLGLGFAWYPERKICDELADGRLKPLPLAVGAQRFTTLYLVYADPDYTGPAARRLGELIVEQAGRG